MAAMRQDMEAALKRQLLAGGRLSSDGTEEGGGAEGVEGRRRRPGLSGALKQEEVEQVGEWGWGGWVGGGWVGGSGWVA